MIYLKSIKSLLFPEYITLAGEVLTKFKDLKEAEISTENFSFYTSVSSVFSSKIEGEEMEIDSFIKHKRFGIEFQPDYTKKIDDLYDAYIFAKNSPLTEDNVLKAHRILSKNILAKTLQGAYREGVMYVLTGNGQIEYVATDRFQLKEEIAHFFKQMDELVKEDLTIEETFFYSSLLHLAFVKIHPMNDGNGRTARLLEKWFLSEKLGNKSWFLQSEKFYYQNHQQYYQNIRKLGLEYEDLDFTKSLDFILMLPKSLNLSFNGTF